MADAPEPTKRAAAFMAANAQSRVVEGVQTQLGRGRSHVVYTLEDGTKYKLTDADHVELTAPVRWLHG